MDRYLFSCSMEKARKFQPLAVLNQKLKGLDVFESNENQSASLPSWFSTARGWNFLAFSIWTLNQSLTSSWWLSSRF
jgi:hypothetical protein